MKEPSRMQHKVYERLCNHYQKHGDMPILSQFARDMGITYMTLQQHLKALNRKGMLLFESRGRGKSPLVQLLRFGVPVVGTIGAGQLRTETNDPEGYLNLHYLSDDSFALRVHGDSMADVVQNDDIVLMKQGMPEHSGIICAVEYDGESTLKYVDWVQSADDEEIVLRPHNHDFAEQRVPRAETKIAGIYQGLLRGVVIDAFYREMN